MKTNRQQCQASEYENSHQDKFFDKNMLKVA